MPNLGENKMWYRDSLVIQEIDYIYIHSTDMEKDTVENVVTGYVFTDLRKSGYYYFSSFTDTARLLDSYRHHDRIEKDYEIWKFDESREVFPETGNAVQLKDTLIEGKTYKRFQANRSKDARLPEWKRFDVVYLDCSIKTIFELFPAFSKQCGCPVVMHDSHSSNSKKTSISRYQLEFITDTLTPYQHKIFDQWSKYAKDHPIP